MNVLVICAGGISTSILVENMRTYASDDMNIKASSISNAKHLITVADVVLGAPQIEYIKKGVEELCKEKNIPFYMIDKHAYGNMDGKSIVEMTNNIDCNESILNEYQKPEYIFTVVYTSILNPSKIIKILDKEFEDRGMNVLFRSINFNEITKKCFNCDKIILCPPMKFLYDELLKQCSPEKIYVIEMKDYALGDAESIVNDLLIQLEFND